MARIYNSKNEEVTNAWAHVGSSITMSRVLEVLNQWHEAQRAQFVKDGYISEHFDTREEKHGHVGAVYVRLDVGSSGAWMLELSTGDIYQIKGYGKVDKKKRVGNILNPEFDGAVLYRERFRHGRFDNVVKA